MEKLIQKILKYQKILLSLNPNNECVKNYTARSLRNEHTFELMQTYFELELAIDKENNNE